MKRTVDKPVAFSDRVTTLQSTEKEMDAETNQVNGKLYDALKKVLNHPLFESMVDSELKLGAPSIKKFGTPKARTYGVAPDFVNYSAWWKQSKNTENICPYGADMVRHRNCTKALLWWDLFV